jgi:hypothetical protein
MVFLPRPTEHRLAAPRERQDVRASDARQGAVLGHMRYVLGFGLALVVVAFAAIYFFFS